MSKDKPVVYDDTPSGIAARHLAWSGEREPSATVEHRIVLALVSDISDRRGLKWEWEAIEMETMEELLETWREIVRQALAERAS